MTIQKLLLVVAVVLFAIFGLVGVGWVDTTHSGAFLGFGLAAFAGSHL